MAEELKRRVAPLLGAVLLGALAAWLAIDDRAHSDSDDVLVLAAGQVGLRAQDGPEHSGQMALPLRWDRLYPGKRGHVSLQIALPALPRPAAGSAKPTRAPVMPGRTGTESQEAALLFTRLGNQVEVRLNDVLVLRLGDMDRDGYDAAKAPQWVKIRPRGDGTDVLRIDANMQALRGGAVSELHFGPQTTVEPMYQRQFLWRQIAPLAYCVTFAVVGLLALGLWARLREALFACFSLASWLGIVRNLDRLWPDPPLPWPAWGMLVNVAYAWHLALMLLFVVLVLQWHARPLRWALLGYLPLSLVLVLSSFALGATWLWSLALNLLAPLGVAVLGGVLWHASRDRPGRLTAVVLAGAGALALPAGVYDLYFVRGSAGAGSGFSLTPLAMFLFVLVMGGVIVDRYVRNVSELRRMNQTLDAKVRARERELEASYAQLREQQAAHAAAAERQRIMRDLHDGVGAQLVGLQSLLRGQQVSPELLRSGVDSALDEMRLAVDSMQIADGDLTTALATLRYRVRPRLEAAGLVMHWQVEEIPAVAGLTPHTTMQIQRILLEALTNVLKHAQARTIWVQCEWRAEARRLRLEVADDGVGLAAGVEGGGQGVKNMRARAESIGGRLTVGGRAPQGCSVVLEWVG